MLSLAGIDVPVHMQGRAFLGPQAEEPREYVYATRDRYDESYDMVRAVRDKRYKYIRNYRPDMPYLLWIPFRNRHPIVQEMWRLHMEGALNEEQSVMFRPRPVEELYDIDNDPHEIGNLAKSPGHLPELMRLRSALDAWLLEVGDWGEVPESEMVPRWYPNGTQPRTAAPVAIPICADNPGIEPATGSAPFRSPMLFQLHCATQGASITYTFESGDAPHWLLYTQPLRIESGKALLRAKAIRIGYRESEETQINIAARAEPSVPCGALRRA